MVAASGDWSGAAARISTPTLVIHGELDPILPLPNGQALADLVPGAHLHVLRGAGHELNPLDLDEIVTTLTAFVARTEAEADANRDA
jgi:pimeloyl-ACP methyl ester carboxylesterase